MDVVRRGGADTVLILSGDHIYKMNYLKFVTYHETKRAALTVAAIRVKKEQAVGTLGVLEADEDGRLLGFEEKPVQPKTLVNAPDYALGSMGVYVFKVDALLQALEEEGQDFGKDVIPEMLGKNQPIFVYDYDQENRIQDFEIRVKDGVREKILVEKTRDSSYWKDVGSIDSYYEANMELVRVDPVFSLYGERWPFRTFQRPLPPTKCILGGRISDSIVCDGCIISGGATIDSLLSPGVIVEKEAVVEQSIVFDDVVIEPGARIKRAIIDKESRIRAGVSVGYDRMSDMRRGCAISDNGVSVVPRGTDLSS
jgi:glucose-1-phosphate adenylyltransferase